MGNRKKHTKVYDEGASNKPKTFECGKPTVVAEAPSIEKGSWSVIVTEKYTGSKCTHGERTPARTDCRRGRIDVYDHNAKLVLTISDSLLEGIAGADRMKTNSDVPFGVYKINEAIPFYASKKDNRISYGPHPRLVFEPIPGVVSSPENSTV